MPFAGAPSLAGFAGYDPFYQPKEKEKKDEGPPAWYGTGFTPDGAYSVINDFGKLRAQAVAQYEASMNNPRGYLETPQEYSARRASAPSIYQNELSAIPGMGGGASAATATPRTFEIGNKLVQLGPNGPTEIYSGQNNDETWINRKLLDIAVGEKKALMSKELPSKGDYEKIADYEKTIATMTAKLLPRTELGPPGIGVMRMAPQPPPASVNWPQQGNILGTTTNNMFQGQAAPVSQQRQSAPARVLKFNRATGQLE